MTKTNAPHGLKNSIHVSPADIERFKETADNIKGYDDDTVIKGYRAIIQVLLIALSVEPDSYAKLMPDDDFRFALLQLTELWGCLES